MIGLVHFERQIKTLCCMVHSLCLCMELVLCANQFIDIYCMISILYRIRSSTVAVLSSISVLQDPFLECCDSNKYWVQGGVSTFGSTTDNSNLSFPEH